MVVQGQCDLKKLIGAGALANAVTFGGCDYVGFHTAMAMLPALEMSRMLADRRQALPVLKVLYRNSQQIQSVGGASKAMLEAIHAAEHASEGDVGTQIRDACRKLDVARGEKLLAGVGGSPLDAFNALQPAIQDDLNVHRFVFAHRTYGLVGLLGEEYSYSMLRQCVRLCADHEREHVKGNHPASPIRTLVPRLLDQYKLDGKKIGKRDPGDKAVDDLCLAIFNGPRQSGRSRRGGASRRDRPGSDRRGDLLGIELVCAAAGDGKLAHAWRFCRCPFVRRHQCLAQHGADRRPAICRLRTDRRSVPCGRSNGAVPGAALPDR
jgi:hypothetical protein